MTHPAREWLPEPALFDGRLERALLEAVNDWAAKWFVREPCVRVALRPVQHSLPSLPADQGWCSEKGDLRLLPSGRARQRLVREALSYSGKFQGKKTEDQSLVRQLSSAILQDLCAFAGRLLPGAAELAADRAGPALVWPEPEWPGISAAIHLFREEDLIVFLFSTDLACRARKALLATPRRRTLPALSLALDAQEVGVSGYAGEARLTLAEFRDMQPGDVLALGRTLTEGIPLSVNRRAFLPLASDVEIDETGAGLRVRGVQHE